MLPYTEILCYYCANSTGGSMTKIDKNSLIKDVLKGIEFNDLVEKFFTEQLDNSESAGFGLALCDLRLFNQNLEPHNHLKIYDEYIRAYDVVINRLEDAITNLLNEEQRIIVLIYANCRDSKKREEESSMDLIQNFNCFLTDLKVFISTSKTVYL